MKNTLVLYFSHSGNSEKVAGWIAGEVGAKLVRVEPKEPYDAEYKLCAGRAVAEWRGNARPEIVALPEHVQESDAIVVVYPLWCGTMPMCLYTAVEHMELAGKRVVGVVTHEGSGFANSVTELQKLCPESRVEQGIDVRGSQVAESEETVRRWAKENL